MLVKLFNRYTLIAALVATVALAVVIYFGWADDPARAAGERVAKRSARGVIPIGLWIAVIVAVAFWRRSLLWRRWRLVVGSAVLVAGIQAASRTSKGSCR